MVFDISAAGQDVKEAHKVLSVPHNLSHWYVCHVYVYAPSIIIVMYQNICIIEGDLAEMDMWPRKGDLVLLFVVILIVSSITSHRILLIIVRFSLKETSMGHSCDSCKYTDKMREEQRGWNFDVWSMKWAQSSQVTVSLSMYEHA